MRCCAMVTVPESRSTSHAQTGCFATAKPAQRDQPPHRMEPVVGDRGEERGQLLRGPDRDDRSLSLLAPGGDLLVGPYLGVRTPGPKQLEVPRRIVRPEAFADGGVERGAQRGADTVQRARRRRPPPPGICCD